MIERLSELDLSSGKFTFELLESIFLDDYDSTVAKNLAAIRNLGIEIDLDDFGTGHASIVGLLSLRPNRIKIDRHFVANIVASEEQKRLTGSMIEMGRSLGIDVLAEGVETKEQAKILAQLGVDAFQGYYYAKPMSAKDLVTFLENEPQDRIVS